MPATRKRNRIRVPKDAWTANRMMPNTRARMAAITARIVVVIHATARNSSGRSRMCARSRSSSRSWFSRYRASTKGPMTRQQNSWYPVSGTVTGFAPFGSLMSRCCTASFVSSPPGRNRFVFARVRFVSSWPNVAPSLAKALASLELLGGRSLARQPHFLADALRGLLGVLIVRDDNLRDLAEVVHALLDHVVDEVHAALELLFHLLVGHVLHLHDLVEQERMALVDERVRAGVPFVHGVRDQLVRLRLEPDELHHLRDPPHGRVADPRVLLDDHELERRQQDPRRVDRRVLQPVHHGLHGI